MARSISPIISMLILFTTTLSIVLSVYFYTLYLNETGRYASQYGFVKNQLVTLATKFPEIVLNKGTYIFSYPSDLVGIGYKPVNHVIEIVLTLDNKSTVYRVFRYEYELVAYVRHPLVSGERIIYNSGNKLIVSKLHDVPFLKEYYGDGFTRLDFSVLNIFMNAFRISSNTNSYVIYEIWVFKIEPLIIDKGSLVVNIRDEFTERISSVKSISIYVDNNMIFNKEFNVPVNTVLKSITLEVIVI